MSVHLKKDGRWIAVWIDPETRKQRRRYFGRGPEAERAARDFDASIPSRQYERRTPAAGGALFSDLANAYAESRIGIMEKVSLDNWLYKMRAVIFPAFGHFRAMAITPARLDAYVALRLKTPKNKNRPDLGTIKRTTVHRELSDIRAVLNWAARRRFIPSNPAAAYEMPKRDDAINLPPSLSEIAAILRNAPDRLARALVLSFYCGLRPGVRELFSLRWSDVDLDAATIAITSARKNGIRARIVPIHRSLRAMLETWRAADSAAGFGPSAPLIHDRGRPVATLKKSWATAKRRAGISRRLPLYSLRHAFATESLRARGDLKAVSSILGHTRTETTTRIYQHLDDSLARDAVDRIPELPLVNAKKDCPNDRRTIH